MSEESDSEDRFASGQDDRSDESGTDEYASEDPDGFLDLEAAESDNSSEGEGNDLDAEQQYFFPQFRLLPPELRHHVWRVFNPDLEQTARVFELVAPVTDGLPELLSSGSLADQTAPARAMLATHRESRELALKSYPHALDIHRGDYSLRYNNEKDVIYVTGDPARRPSIPRLVPHLGGTRYVAFDRPDLEEMQLAPPLPRGRLKVIFTCHPSALLSHRSLRWCVSDLTRSYYMRTTEDDECGRPVDIEQLFCWPDLDNPQNQADDTVEWDGEKRLLYKDVRTGFEIRSMVHFLDGHELRRYRKLEASRLSREGKDGTLSPSDTETETNEDGSETDEDEYESEGIDDATIDDDDNAGEDEDDLEVQSGSDDDDTLSFGGFSPPRGGRAGINWGDGVGVGSFSSLEPESPNPGGDDSEHDSSDQEATRKVARNKRRIVSSEDEHDPEPVSDEVVKRPSRPAKRARVVLSDTEDEGEEDEIGGAATVDDSATEPEDGASLEEDSDAPEDAEPIQTKPMSLFEKLRQYRQDNPVLPESDPNSGAEASAASDDFDGGDDTKFQDDESEDEPLNADSDNGAAVDMSDDDSEEADYEE